MGRTHVESAPRLVITLYHHHFFCQVKLFNVPVYETQINQTSQESQG